MSDMNPAQPLSPAPKRRRPWGKIVLFVSLALNLLIVGLVVGTMMGGPRDRDRNPASRDLGFGPFVHALPRADKAALGSALKREAGSFEQNRAALRRNFVAFLGALRTVPFDAEEARRLIAEQQGRVSERQRLGQKLLLERLVQMDPQDRAAYANALDRLLKRRAPRR